MNAKQLAACTGATLARATKFLPVIEAAMAEFDIVGRARQAAFLAQVGHESGGLYWLKEVWGPTKAQAGYEGRADLGNTQPGDGKRFCGRGLLQTTGRANYAEVSAALGFDFVLNYEALALPENAARSAGWYWKRKGLNSLADKFDILNITKRINGGLNGYDERVVLYRAALRALT